MKDFAKKAAYIKGFADGLDISPKSEEGRLLNKLVEFVEEMAAEIDSINSYSDELTERIDIIDEDLGDLEESFYGDEDLDFSANDDDDYDFADDDDYDFSDDDDDFDDDGMDYFEIECPNCKDDVLIDYDMLEDGKKIICPGCKEEIELEFDCDCDCDCDDDDCDCGCHDHD